MSRFPRPADTLVDGGSAQHRAGPRARSPGVDSHDGPAVVCTPGKLCPDGHRLVPALLSLSASMVTSRWYARIAERISSK
jgi:hypothetical protein